MLLNNSVIGAGIPPAGPTIQDNFLQDIYSWSGSQAITGTATYFNLATLTGLLKAGGGTAGTSITANAILFPAIVKKSQVVLSARLTGTIAGAPSTEREWMIQTRRTDGTTVIASDASAKLGGTSIANRDVSLITYTDGLTDPFSVTGVQFGLFNDSGQTITLTAVRILVQRTVNQT